MNIKTLYSLFIENNQLISTDTRTISKGSLFFALKGGNFNGNKYAEDALKKGASYAIIDEKRYQKDEQTILVANVLETLQQLAGYHKKRSNFKVIALTGSNGKTTTKELTSTVLSKKYTVSYTHGNLNNHIGVPLTILSTPKNQELLVLEMGANHVGEIALLATIADPDFGLITNIGNAHLEGFGSIEGVLKAKTELFEYLKKNNRPIFFNQYDTCLNRTYKTYEKLSVPFIFNPHKINIDKNQLPLLSFSANFNDTPIAIKSNLTGNYNSDNICAALTIGSYFNVAVSDMILAIENYTPDNKRSQVLKTDNNTIILDCYNANPSSMEVALRNFKQLPAENKVVILGEMKELGGTSNQRHQQVATMALNAPGIETVYLVGKGFENIVPTDRTTLYNSTEDLKEVLIKLPVKNKTILLKGSRFNNLEVLVEYL